MIGKSISHYTILSKLGEGGMGVVYKAKDTKLDRDVALKFLPANQLGTGDDQQRFEQEAKAAAKLSHANIATVFEINEHEGETFIAMECIDGETLSDMVEKRPLKIKDAIKIAKQIAEGLHSAHEQGIVHRDIKSANIMLTAKGVVKIMDFGLAKVSEGSMVTKAGTTLGTISYMSPEQAQGEKVDHRSDIWSLGVVLYEMISGQMPFKGDYESAIIYSIMNENPEPLTSVRTGVPMKLEEIVNKLLAKDATDRYQNIVELPVDLKIVAVQETATTKIGSSETSEPPRDEESLTKKAKYSHKTILMFAMAILMTFLLTWIFRPESPPPDLERPYNLVVPLLENTFLHFSHYNRMAISRDGKDLVYVGRRLTGWPGLFLKRAGSFNSSELLGTKQGRGPFFSPDGRWIGYLNPYSNEILKVLVEGGEPLKVTTFGSSHLFDGATWAEGNTIVFTDKDVLKRVSESGGEAIEITKTKSQGEWHLYPHMLPDGKTVLFTIGSMGSELNTYRLAVFSFGDDEYRIILDEEGYNAVYSKSGHILYGRSNRLMGVPFDLDNLRITGVPAPVLDNVSTSKSGSGSMSYAISNEGTIAYSHATGSEGERSVVHVDLSGNETEFMDLKMDFRSARYSPDGKYVAFSIREENSTNFWIYHVNGYALNQLTFYEGGIEPYLAWSPDSKTIAYSTTAEDSTNSIYIRRIDKTGTTDKIYTSHLDTPIYVSSWSSDGLSLTFDQVNGEFGYDLFVFSFEDSTTSLYHTSPANEEQPQFSPNGKWVLYESNELGSKEIYVRPYPESKSGVLKISDGPGSRPIWSPDGNRIYYINGREMYSVGVSLEDAFLRDNPQEIFEGNYFGGNGDRKYDIHPAGNRFIIPKRPETAPHEQKIFVIQNFDEELKRLMPVEKN